MKKYDWKLILTLSLPGPVMGVLTLYGIIPFGIERWFWLTISIVAAVVIARGVKSHAFGHGAIVGFLLGASAIFIKAAWSELYAANNPALLQKLSGATGGPEFQYRMLMLVPFIGLSNALLVGLMSFFTFKAMRGQNQEANN
ncbi:MAG: hypothetical protein PVF33_02930 [Candidatus Latescibacterota bacterium]|jgi:hypothetical protein